MSQTFSWRTHIIIHRGHLLNSCSCICNPQLEIRIPQLSLRWHNHLHGLEAPIHVARCDFKPCKPAVRVDQSHTVSVTFLTYHQSTPLSCQPTNINEFPHFFGTNTVTPTAKSRRRIDVHRRSSKKIQEKPQEKPTAQLLDISSPMHYDLSVSSKKSKTGLGEIKKNNPPLADVASLSDHDQMTWLRF